MRTTVAACLDCGSKVDEHTHVGGNETPKPGDATLCWYCGSLMMYLTIEPLSFRKPTEEEFKELAGHQELQTAVRMVKLGILR